MLNKMEKGNFWQKALVDVTNNSIKSLVTIFLSGLVVAYAAIYNPLNEICSYQV